MTFRADDALANSTVNIVSLDAVKALSESSIEVKAFSRDGTQLSSTTYCPAGQITMILVQVPSAVSW